MNKQEKYKSSDEMNQVLENLVKLLGLGAVAGGLVAYRYIKNNQWVIRNRTKSEMFWIFLFLALVGSASIGVFYYYNYSLKLLFLPLLGVWCLCASLVYITAPLWLSAFRDKHIVVNDLNHSKIDFSPLDQLLWDPKQVPIGVSIKTYKPFCLLMENRTEHLLVSGATGQGKTSLMITLLKHAFVHNHGAIIIDPKGELFDINLMRGLAKHYGKKDSDFVLFSLADVASSASYNVLKIGTPEQKKSKIKIGLGLDHEHYGDIAAQAIGTFIDILDYLNIEITVKKLRDLFIDKIERGNLAKLVHGIQNESDSRLFLSKLELINEKKKEDLSGVISKLDNLCAREFMPIVGNPDPKKAEIDLLAAIQNQKIVYFQMNTNGYADTSIRIGKLIIQDLKLISSMIQSGRAKKGSAFTGVFVDEFGSFAMPDFADFLKQVRSANIGLHLFFQGSADLRNVSEVFEEQVLGNTIVKIIFRQDVNSDVEKWAHMAGTEDAMIQSYQTTNTGNFSTRTGMGNVHEGKRMKIDFDIFKNLTRGKAVVIDKGRRTHDVIAVWDGKN
jgi:hypothetical protein